MSFFYSLNKRHVKCVSAHFISRFTPNKMNNRWVLIVIIIRSKNVIILVFHGVRKSKELSGQ